MNLTAKHILVLFMVLSGATGFAQKPFYSKEYLHYEDSTINYGKIDHTVYLIGDAGEIEAGEVSGVDLLKAHIAKEDDKSTVVFLGDNIYPRGMPVKEHKDRAESENLLNEQLDMFNDYQGEVYFIPGNHDWDQWSKDGWKAVKRQEKFIEKHEGGDIEFLPNKGCPGPVKVKIKKDVILVLVDTQWWLHEWDKPYGEDCDCKTKNEFEFIDKIEKIALENQDKQILLAGHHPVYTNGNHGGKFQFKDHIFPLTAVNKALFIPLPILGSIYPMYRKHRGSIQDITNEHYQLFITKLLGAVEGHPNFIYASGHEHSLQYFEKKNQHFIVSGAGSKTHYVAKGNGAEFTQKKQGFSKVLYLDNGETWIEFWVVSEEDTNGELVFRKKIKNSKIDKNAEKPESIMIAASDKFAAGPIKRVFLGDNHRDVWGVPVEVPVLDLKEEGLRAIKLGGGKQTKSLRLENKKGTQFIFRSIEKNPAKVVLPEDMQNTWVADVMRDQVSMSHPYGVFAIPPLADAAGILHKKSKLVYIPDNTRLGPFREVYKNTLASFEVRANKKIKDVDGFGSAKKAIGTPDMVQLLHDDYDNVVDEEDMLRNRLFDMLVGDFDRHDDQWRWAQFGSESKGYTFRPVPRDRDQVFDNVDGVLSWIASRKFAPGRLLQNFDHEIKDLVGLNLNGRELDKTFLTRLTKDDWIDIAKDLQKNLPDSTIRNAFKVWPENVYELGGEEIVQKLISRRDDLVYYAVQYYEILAEEVEVVGTNKPELFEIFRDADGNTTVKVYKKYKQTKKSMTYSRTFKKDETKQVIIYGLGGDDQFEIYGNTKSCATVRLVGGDGLDIFNDISTVKGASKKTIIYDEKTGTVINGGRETRDNTSDKDYQVNEYKRFRFKPDIVAPLGVFGFNVDDGLKIGGGITIKKQGWRKEHYASKQQISAATASKTGAVKFEYDAHFNELVKKWSLYLKGKVLAPNNSTNFYGYGNETMINQPESDFYRLNFNLYRGDLKFGRQFSENEMFALGTSYEHISFTNLDDRFISSPESGINPSELNETGFFGLNFSYELSTLDIAGKVNGVKWNVNAEWLNNTSINASMSAIASEFTYRRQFKLPFSPVLSSRIGGRTIFGDYNFYQASTLGGQNKEMESGNMRGFHRDRYSGRSVAYQNTDLRLRFFNIKSYLFPGGFGMLGFFDAGRVWNGENSSVIHTSYGGGLWLELMHMITLVGTYETSTDGSFITLRTKFLF